MPWKGMPVYSMSKDKSCIILFAKAPIQGHVKTRLAKKVGAPVAVNLYRHFVLDIMDKITSAGHCLKIFHDPPGSLPLMEQWLGQQHNFYLQTGCDLGEKMANAFDEVFEGGTRKAVLIGADFPDLPGGFISDALEGLDTHDAVIGPTIDGGYYLIGFSSVSYIPEVFNDMPWGTSAVYSKTMRAFTASEALVHTLPQWRDIDVYDDLRDLIQSLKHHPDQATNTFSFLKQIGMIKK